MLETLLRWQWYRSVLPAMHQVRNAENQLQLTWLSGHSGRPGVAYAVIDLVGREVVAALRDNTYCVGKGNFLFEGREFLLVPSVGSA